MNDRAASMSPVSRWHTASWVLYDLANTIFAATITYLFTPSLNAAAVGVTNTVAMLVAGVSTPVVACLADHTGRASRYCTLATLGCIACMALLGAFDSAVALLAVFFAAMVCYQAALVFYNALLPSVASEERTGRVSGWGIGRGRRAWPSR